MTDVKYIGGNPVCDVTARGDIAVLQDDTEYTQDIPLSWTHGTISVGNGSGTASDTRIYTLGFTPITEGLKLSFSEGVKVSLRFYSDAVYTSYIGSETVWRTASPVDLHDAATSHTGANFVRFVAAYTDDSDVSSDASMATLGGMVGLVKSYHIKDLESRVADEEKRTFNVAPSNSLLGNITIRAGKTINFADGTPPHIDWYLIHDIDNNFYMTRDFVSKKIPLPLRATDWHGS